MAKNVIKRKSENSEIYNILNYHHMTYNNITVYKETLLI